LQKTIACLRGDLSKYNYSKIYKYAYGVEIMIYGPNMDF